MISSDFEYRLYSGSVAGVPIDLALATELNEFIGGLRLATGRPIRDQLADFFADQNLTWSFFGNEFDLRPTIDDAIANVDAALTFDPIELFLGQGRWPLIGPVYARLRFYFVSGFELRLPEEKALANWPDLPALLDPDADQLRIQLNVEQISLLDAGLRVHIYNPFKNEWPELFTVPLLSGTGLYDVATRLALGLSVEPDAYVIGAGSGQRFRPVVPTILQRDSTIDRAEFRFGQVDEWVILALGFLFGLVGALTAVFLSQLQVALGERVLQKIEDDIEAKLAEIDIPTIFDFPSVAKYGAAFERPATEQVTFEYRPGPPVSG